MTVSTIGLDIAKSEFHVQGLTAKGAPVLRKRLKRARVLEWFAQQPSCVVGMEACAGAHYWARELEALGHEVKLLPPHKVKAFLQGAKNDYNDALAIALAAQQSAVRAVPVKSVEQQSVQLLHRQRELTKGQRTAHINALRAAAYEFGVTFPQGVGKFRARVPEVLEDATNALSDVARVVLSEGMEMLAVFDERLLGLEAQLKREQAEDAAAKRLSEIPGIALLGSTALPASIGDGRQFRRGRDFSASIGLVPRQHSSGGKTVLLGISKCGDRYLRYLFINGARSVLSWVRTQARRGEPLDPLRRWALAVLNRRGFNKAVVALANRLARIAWAVLRSGERYDPQRVGAGA